MVKGKAGRQLPSEACAGIGIHRHPSASAAWASLDPWLEPGLREEAAPQQGASPGAMGLRRCREVFPSGGRDGGHILHHPPCRACRLPRRPGSRSIFLTDFCREGEKQVVLLGEGRRIQGQHSGRDQEGALPVPQSPWRTFPPVFLLQTQSGLQIHAGIEVLSPPQRDAGGDWAVLGAGRPASVCPCWDEGSHPWMHPGEGARS